MFEKNEEMTVDWIAKYVGQSVTDLLDEQE